MILKSEVDFQQRVPQSLETLVFSDVNSRIAPTELNDAICSPSRGLPSIDRKGSLKRKYMRTLFNKTCVEKLGETASLNLVNTLKLNRRIYAEAGNNQTTHWVLVYQSCSILKAISYGRDCLFNCRKCTMALRVLFSARNAGKEEGL